MASNSKFKPFIGSPQRASLASVEISIDFDSLEAVGVSAGDVLNSLIHLVNKSNGSPWSTMHLVHSAVKRAESLKAGKAISNG